MQKDKKNKRSYTLVNCFLIGLLLTITVVYLFEVNTGISYGLIIRESDLKLRDLRLENERLVKQAAELGSIANLYIFSHNLRMTETAQVDYLTPVDETLAKR